ncbi:MAG: fatty-acyl-CoA synthase [Pseudonocardiales bacterium]|jgi:fatty-acyl-CoA synthase|nr:fatty-acyl-CoA synthase [Pseudonocardiales bacterium]
MSAELLWPDYCAPHDLARIEAVPLEQWGLPESTCAMLLRAGELWPDSGAGS